jgi:hypothetical protein
MNTTMETELHDYLSRAKGIAWDTCHKVYILMDDEQMQWMRVYEYDPLISADTMTQDQLFDTVSNWYEDSCGLRFIQAVDTIEGYYDIVPQAWKEEEEASA